MRINDTSFGKITVDNKTFNHDIIITLSGEIKPRQKSLSKRLFGTSHKLSLDEAKYIYEEGVEFLIIGAGQYNCLSLSPEASDFLKNQGIEVIKKSTPEAIKEFNLIEGKKIGLFHITC